jgi:hypothetical protein
MASITRLQFKKLKEFDGSLKCFKPMTGFFKQMVQDETVDPEQTTTMSVAHVSVLGFSRKENIEALHQMDGCGTFAWSTERMLERIGAVNFANAKDLKAKQLHMAGCMCELAYDLALTQGDNVSQSPGFETPLGTFGGVKK